jgi:hypothetical protein
VGKEILIKFAPDMKKAILEGRKCATSRNEKKGELGDFFLLNGRRFVLDYLQHRTLGGVANWAFVDEGFKSPEAFRKRWRELHRGHYCGINKVWVHWFKEAF